MKVEVSLFFQLKIKWQRFNRTCHSKNEGSLENNIFHKLKTELKVINIKTELKVINIKNI